MRLMYHAPPSRLRDQGSPVPIGMRNVVKIDRPAIDSSRASHTAVEI
jgi:hypothetical protein